MSSVLFVLNHGQHIGVAREQPFAVLLIENSERVSRARHWRRVRRRDDDAQLRPHLSPIADHLDFMNFALSVELWLAVARLRPHRRCDRRLTNYGWLPSHQKYNIL